MIYQLKNSRTGEAIPEFETTVEVKKTKPHLTFDFYCKNTKIMVFSKMRHRRILTVFVKGYIYKEKFHFL